MVFTAIILPNQLVLSSQPLIGTHQALLEYIATKTSNLEDEEVITLFPKILEVMKSKTLANEIHEFTIRKELAKAYSDKSQYQLAARALSEMHLDQLKE
jgi:hypothetical protein